MNKIHSRNDLIELAQELGVRPDWHEPDEQDLTAKFAGQSFDNAGFWPPEDHPNLETEAHELCVGLYKTEYDEHVHERIATGPPVAVVNLATLFAWATGYESNEHEAFERGYNVGKIHGRDEAGAQEERVRTLRYAADKLRVEASRIEDQGA